LKGPDAGSLLHAKDPIRHSTSAEGQQVLQSVFDNMAAKETIRWFSPLESCTSASRDHLQLQLKQEPETGLSVMLQSILEGFPGQAASNPQHGH
jgi:hypothetical protein